MTQETKRMTVYFNPHIYRLLKLKAAENDCSVSELVNESVQRSLKEDALDLSAARSRQKEPSRRFEEFIEEMHRSGLL